MPSNKDLIKQVEELAEKLGIKVSTKGLNNEKLAELVSGLKSKKKVTEAVPGYSIAKGRAITSRRGILADGDEIKENDLAGGQKALDAFVKSGHVVKG